MTLRILVLKIVIPCSMVDCYKHFGGLHCLHLQGGRLCYCEGGSRGCTETVVPVYLHGITPHNTAMLIFSFVITSKLSDIVQFFFWSRKFSSSSSTCFCSFPLFFSPSFSFASLLHLFSSTSSLLLIIIIPSSLTILFPPSACLSE